MQKKFKPKKAPPKVKCRRGLTNAELRELMKANKPPQGWYDDEETLRLAVATLAEQDADLAGILGGISDMENGRHRPFADFDVEFRERNQIEKKK